MLSFYSAPSALAPLHAAQPQRVRRRPLRQPAPASAALTFRNTDVAVDTSSAQLERGIGLVDITQLVRDAVHASGVRNGVVTISSRHTTTAVCINENETRLFADVQAFLLQLAPPLPTSQYKHNDIALRCAHPLWNQACVGVVHKPQTEILTSHASAQRAAARLDRRR
jgi:thiamine phosphate synthase YjbQ (UPF0047 family)